MAYTAQQLQNMGYYGYAGWGDAEANANYLATGGAGKGGPSSSGGGNNSSSSPNTYQSSFQNAYQMQQQANQPSIDLINQSLAGLPAITAQKQGIIDTSKSNLKTIYDNLLAKITGKNNQIMSSEYAKRGIPMSSGMVQQDIFEKNTAIESDITAQKLAQENELNMKSIALLEEQQKMEAAWKQLLVSINSGDVNGAMSAALALQSQQQSASQFAQSQALKEKEFEESVNQFYYAQNNQGPTAASTAATTKALALKDLQADISSYVGIQPLILQYKDQLSFNEILNLYNSSSPYGPAHESIQELRDLYDY